MLKVCLLDLRIGSLFKYGNYIYQILGKDDDFSFSVKEFAFYDCGWFPSKIERITIFQSNIQIEEI